MRKKRLLILCLIILILAVIGITTLKIINLLNGEQNQEKETIKLAEVETIQFCNNETDCPREIENIYAKLEYNIDYPKMQQWIEAINKETEHYYQEVINSSTLDDPTCSEEFKNTYKYKISVQTDYSIYTGDQYASLAVKRIKSNLCTGENVEMPINVYIYDLQNKKEISQEELKNTLNLTNDIVKESIENNIEMINQFSKKSFTVEDTYQNGNLDYILYYNPLGELLASYYQNSDKSYYSVVIKSN